MKAERIVKNDIYYNVSMLISDLYADNVDELHELMLKNDYYSALEEHPDLDDILDWYDVHSIQALLEFRDIGDISYRFNIEPYQNEALEHWIVSEWLADKLEECGEMVIRDFKGLTLWGRNTSGQNISIDYVIKKIAREL